MYFVYAIRSKKDSRIYVGMTESLDTRLEYHNRGWNTSTKGYRPWELVYQESAENRKSARMKEKYFKSGVGKEWLKEYIRTRGI